MSKKLRCLQLDSGLVEKLNRHNLITCKDVLKKSSLELLTLIGVSIYSAEDILKRASEPDLCAIFTYGILALELLEARQRNDTTFLKTCLDRLDAVLHGGFPAGTITEIAGPAGCGKTQFSLMMTVNALLLNRNQPGIVVYIDTEGAFDPDRLVEIARSRYPDNFATDDAINDLTSRVYVYKERTCVDLTCRLENLEEIIVEKRVCLVIVDSIASLVRKEFDVQLSKNLFERNKVLMKHASILKYLAETYSFPVVVTNQVTTHVGKKRSFDEDDDGSLIDEEGYVTVALGNTWSHCVNTRLILQYTDFGKVREILVAKSSLAPFTKFAFVVVDSGLELTEIGANFYAGCDPGLQKIKVRSSLALDCDSVNH